MTADLDPLPPSQITGDAGPIQLATGERPLYRASFSPHLLLTHLKVSLVVTNRRVIVQEPHTLFGVIAHGYAEHSSRHEVIAEVVAGDRLSSRKFVWGAGAALFALYALAQLGGLGAFGVLLALALLVAAAAMFLTARVNGVFLRNTGGGLLVAPAGRQQRALVDEAKAAINEILMAAERPGP